MYTQRLIADTDSDRIADANAAIKSLIRTASIIADANTQPCLLRNFLNCLIYRILQKNNERKLGKLGKLGKTYGKLRKLMEKLGKFELFQKSKQQLAEQNRIDIS